MPEVSGIHPPDSKRVLVSIELGLLGQMGKKLSKMGSNWG
jgi:hypothetical protein